MSVLFAISGHRLEGANSLDRLHWRRRRRESKTQKMKKRLYVGSKIRVRSALRVTRLNQKCPNVPTKEIA
jgi:hypothetical protein